MYYKTVGDYIEIGVEPINQNGATFYIGKLRADLLLSIYTVRPTIYDVNKHADFAKSFEDDKDYYNSLAEIDKNKLEKQDFQRTYDQNRIRKIAEFLNEENYAFFPNTIIANCELINEFSGESESPIESLEEYYKSKSKPSHLAYFDEDKEILVLPKLQGSLLVIDGQHRLRGLEHAKKSVIENYEILLAFIIGVSRSVIAKQFYTINYEQKSVNKSLLYHLTGEFSTQIDELSFLHNCVRVLNEVEKSPFFKRIKMLGSNPPNATEREKRQLSISQAFLIDSLMKTVSSNALGSKFLPIFLAHFKREKYHIEIIRFLIKYFNVIRSRLPEWETPDESILSKGMGVGAFIKVLQLVYPIIHHHEMTQLDFEISKINEEDLSKYLNGIETLDFTKAGPFAGVGSSGSVNKIKSSIIESLSFLKTKVNYDNYNDFLEQTEQFRNQYKSWLDKRR